MEKLIITAAPTGSVPQKKDNPHVPVTTGEIVDCALRCEDAGASIYHIHARDQAEKPSDDPARFLEVVEGLQGRCDMILQVSTGGRAGVGLESRLARLAMRPEMASLTTGSVNFPTQAYVNDPALVDGLAAHMLAHGIKPEMECFDVGMIYNALDLVARGLARAPLHLNFVMGMKGVIPGTIEHLVHMWRCLPPGATWTVSGIGRAQLPLGTHAILMGGHVRTGLEDNIYYKRGELADNPRLVARVARLAAELGRPVATPDEARAILGLTPRI